MKKLKYIFAISSLCIPLFTLSYNVNTSSKEENTSIHNEKENKSDNINEEEINNDSKLKSKIISSYNRNYSYSKTLNLLKGNIKTNLNETNPVNLDFTGDFLILSNSLSSYYLDSVFSYNGNKENFSINYGKTEYTSLNHNNKNYLFKNNNELKGILSFPKEKLNYNYSRINTSSSFSSIFNEFLNINEEDYELLSSSNLYILSSDKNIITLDNNYNLITVESKNNSSNLEYSLSFNQTVSNITNSITKIDSSSTDIITTLKSLLKNQSLNINFNASVNSKSSNNYTFTGDLKFDYSSYIINKEPTIELNLNHYTNNSFSNYVSATYLDNDIYFELNNTLKGSINDTTASELITYSSGLISSTLDYDLNTPLNKVINTTSFDNILNLDINSFDATSISNLSINNNLISFNLNGNVFGINDKKIIFEIGLSNAKIKTLKIKDLNYNEDKTISLDLYFNTPNDSIYINKDSYPSYNSILPFYQNVLSIMEKGEAEGSFSTSLLDSNNSTSYSFSTNYDINFKDLISYSDLKYLNIALKDFSINYIDSKDDTRKSQSIMNAMLLEDTSSNSLESLNINIDNLYFKNNNFYINYKGSKLTTSIDSISNIINSISTLSGGNTSDGATSTFKNEIKRLNNLITYIKESKKINEIIKDVKNNYSLSKIDSIFKITNNNDGSIKFEFNLSNILDNDNSILESYSLNSKVSFTLGFDGEITDVNIHDLSLDGYSLATHLGTQNVEKTSTLSDFDVRFNWTDEFSNNDVKDLGKVMDVASSLIESTSNMYNTTITSLISLNVKYNEMLLNGDFKTKFYYDKSSKTIEKYVEGKLPIILGSSSNLNDINKANIEFIYSDNNEGESSLTNIKSSRQKEGTQFSVSLEYGKNDSRSNSKLFGYSSHETINDVLDSLSNISENNTLYPYKMVREVINYSQEIKNILNLFKEGDVSEYSDVSIISILNKFDIKALLDSLTQEENQDLYSLKVSLDLSSINQSLNDTLDITLSLSKDSENYYHIRKIEASNKDNTLSVNLDVKSNEYGNDTTSDLISNFVSIKENTSSQVHYLDASNIYNLVKLGIYTTEKKYYRINGTLNFDSNAIINLPVLGNITFDEIKPLNNLNFDIKLNLFKDNDDPLDEVYKIKGYLKAQEQKNTSTITEFLIEPGVTEQEGTVYVCKSTKSNNYSNITYTNTSNNNFNNYFNNNYSSNYSSYSLSSTSISRNGYNKNKGDKLSSNYRTRSEAENYLNNLLSQYPELDGKIKISETEDYTKPIYVVGKGEISGTKQCKSNSTAQNYINNLKNKYNNSSKYNSSQLNNISIKNEDHWVWEKRLFKKHSDYYAYASQDIYVYEKETNYYLEAIDNINIDTIYNYNYQLKYNNENSISNTEIYHMSKDKFLGKCTYNNDSNNMIPRLLYYLLDYSGVLNEETVSLSYLGVKANVKLKELMISNIFASINGETSTPSINYLNGWDINTSSNNDFLSGSIKINPGSLVSGIGTSGASIDFNTGINLSFNQLSDEKRKFKLNQLDSSKYLISASMSTESVSMKLNVKINESTFNFTASNSSSTINNEMYRYDTFVYEYKTNPLTMYHDEYYVTNINAGETNVQYKYTFPLGTLTVSCSYNVNFNNSSNRYSGSMVGNNKYFKGIEF